MKQIAPRGRMEWQVTVLLERDTGIEYQDWLDAEDLAESVHVRHLIKAHLKKVRKQAQKRGKAEDE